jgi:alanyl-tRNA synthetase
VTERLYYTHPYLCDFTAQVIDSAGNKIYLDRTAFYPASGGQPSDTGTLGASRVLEVIDEDHRIAHVLEGDAPSGTVAGRIDWDRRFDHMQQHSGQHLLSAVLHELFNVPTVSFHLGSDYLTIDVEASSLDSRQVEQAQDRANAIVFENRPIQISFEEQTAELGLRKASEREGVLRVISIEGIDRSACGGTHVRSTAEIGPVQIRKLEKMRGNIRIEFLCGWRAIRRARADYACLAEAAKTFSCGLDEVPQMVNATVNRAQEIEKARKKICIEVAQYRGRELYGSTEPRADGFRRLEQRIDLGDDARAIAAAFTAGERAVYLAVSEAPPALLLAVSKDSGLNAGDIVKAAVSAQGGRGGGNAMLAQGSVPSREALDRALSDIQSRAMIAAR